MPIIVPQLQLGNLKNDESLIKRSTSNHQIQKKQPSLFSTQKQHSNSLVAIKKTPGVFKG